MILFTSNFRMSKLISIFNVTCTHVYIFNATCAHVSSLIISYRHMCTSSGKWHNTMYVYLPLLVDMCQVELSVIDTCAQVAVNRITPCTYIYRYLCTCVNN